MPYLRFPTPVNGFYDEAMKTSSKGRAILYAKMDNNNDENEVGIDYNDPSIKEAYSNNYYPIAVTSISDTFSMTTQIQWEQGGNIVEAFIASAREGMQSATRNFRELVKIGNDAFKKFQQLLGKEVTGLFDDAMINKITKMGRRQIISAQSAYKTFGGSNTTINIGQLDFTFPAIDFNCTHMKQAWALLSYLLPVVGVQKGGKEDKMQTQSTIKNADGTETSEKGEISLENISWMYESAPNGYFNPMNGYETSMIEGTFAIDINGNLVTELVPVGVNILASRSRVLSEQDYLVENATGNKEVPSDLCMKTFYPNELEYNRMILRTPTNPRETKKHLQNVPSVLKIQVQFDFAKKITVYDYYNSLFKGMWEEGEKIKGSYDGAQEGIIQVKNLENMKQLDANKIAAYTPNSQVPSGALGYESNLNYKYNMKGKVIKKIPEKLQVQKQEITKQQSSIEIVSSLVEQSSNLSSQKEKSGSITDIFTSDTKAAEILDFWKEFITKYYSDGMMGSMSYDRSMKQFRALKEKKRNKLIERFAKQKKNWIPGDTDKIKYEYAKKIVDTQM